MMNEFYKVYLKEVLGVNQWLRPADLHFAEPGGPLPIFEFDGPLRPERISQQWDLVTVHLQKSTESYFEGEAQQLYLKMKAAMKLGSLRTLDLEFSIEHQELAIPWIQSHLKAHAWLMLTDSPRGYKAENLYEAWSPQSLLQNSERKKEAWEVLQKIMAHLKSVSKLD